MNKFKLTIAFIVCVLSFLPLLAFAEQAESTPVFNATLANKTFDDISLKLSTQNLNPENLKHAIGTIEKLNKAAQRCVDDNQRKISLLDDFVKESPAAKSTVVTTQTADYKYLQSKIAQYTKTASNCRLFIIRTQVALVAYKQTIQKLSTQRTLQRSIPIWRVTDSVRVPTFENIDVNLAYDLSGFSLLTHGQIFNFVLIVVSGSLVGLYSRRLLKRLLPITNSARMRRILNAVNTNLLVLCTVLVLTAIYLAIIFFHVSPEPTIKLLNIALLIFTLGLISAKIIIFSFPQFNIFKGLTQHQVKPIYLKLRWLLLWILSYYVLILIFREQQIPDNFIESGISLFFTVLIGLTAWFFWFFVSTLCFNLEKYRLTHLLKFVVIGAFSFILVIQMVGYHRLAIYIFTASIITIFLGFLTWMLLKLTENVCNFLENNKSRASQRFRYFLGVKPYKKLFELGLIRASIVSVILCFYVILMMRVWKVSAIYSDQLIDGILHGFKFVGLSIYPSRVFLAIIIFGISLLLGRFVSTYVARHHEFEGEKDTQVAIASIIKYAWTAASIIVTLLISGFNFTNLAIIAGAFSVGIGLGMQHIVTNFVSGLILLLEKPIKPGDRISVNGTEGFVRKIRARSTQITTPGNEDIIVPNSDLINQPVTNFMFRNRNGRITCKIGVAYNSDVNLVQELLMKIAMDHPEVLKDSQHLPSVCFHDFGTSSLNFMLWCGIGDVNKKYHVLNDINFAIYHAFKQHNIEIAYPQIDIHLKKED